MHARFVGAVVAPLWRALARLVGAALDEPLRNIEAGIVHYEARARANE